ncbi:MAG TPA: sulfite exporter TauE/SafE family protein [Herpetosiphonaceae bacterium]|nr:sulfite exporter TauE/SafE family protein [Herpetosiphonaceae bacterium]
MIWLIGLALAGIAFLYATTGQAGGSGYIAVLSWFGLAATVIRPTALVLNCVVAVMTSYAYARAGWFSWRRFWPLTILAVPAALLGGRLVLTGYAYHVFVALCLLWAAARLLRRGADPAAPPSTPPPHLATMAAGGIIGFVSGLTGIGGGIFLTPVLVMRGWATAQEAAGLAAPFILVNSLAALLAHPAALGQLPLALPAWGAGVVAGGWLGARVGSRRLSPRRVEQILAAILLLTGLYLLIP